MTATRKCPSCDTLLPSNLPPGLCPACRQRLADDPSPFEAVYEKEVWSEEMGPTLFGDYELLRQIGRGGMGVVYEARQINLNRTVALKLILDGDLASSSAIRRFRIEAEAAAKLDHPNIVAVYEFGDSDGLPFLIMRYVAGRSLDRVMASLSLPAANEKTGGLPAKKGEGREAQERIAGLVASLARALHYAHENGVVHCDVKPSNILIDASGQPHLTDFGIARLMGMDVSLTRSGVLGTPRYMAPEQAAGRRDQVTAATDIYGVGVILYELLTGRAPFRGDTPHETVRQVIEREPDAPHEVCAAVPRDLSIICLKCLEKNPAHRYGAASELADDLERWIRREPIHARRTSVPERMWRWCQRKPIIASLTASVGILLVLIATVSILFAWNLSYKEQQREVVVNMMRNELSGALDRFWEDPKTTSLTINSDKRRVLGNREPWSALRAGEVQTVTFGVYLFQKPSVMARNFTHMLDYLETFMTERLQRPVAIDFTIYRTYEKGQAALLSGEVDFMRVGPSSYVLMNKIQPGITLLVAQENIIQCTIFARRDSAIANLEDLRGKAFAFGDPESTYGTFMAKYALWRANLRARDLSPISTHFTSHDEVEEMVGSGKYAAGSANIVAVNLNTFKELHRFTNELRMPFVVRSGLDPTVFLALQEALLLQKSPEVLTNLVPSLKGFRKVSDRDYDELRVHMEESKKFDEH